jgi:hypothetical protein
LKFGLGHDTRDGFTAGLLGIGRVDDPIDVKTVATRRLGLDLHEKVCALNADAIGRHSSMLGVCITPILQQIFATNEA